MAPPPAEVAAYRQSLDDVTTLALAELAATWRTFTMDDAGAVMAGLLDTLPALVDGYFVVAATVAADWYDTMRADLGARGRFAAVPAEPFDPSKAEALARWGVGPLYGADPDPDLALSKLSGGLQRAVSTGARETVRGSAVMDPGAEGWQRVTSPGACAFCVLLAGRGAVYKEATRGFASHDRCGCSAVPEFGGPAVRVGGFVRSSRFESQAARDANNRALRDYLRT